MNNLIKSYLILRWFFSTLHSHFQGIYTVETDFQHLSSKISIILSESFLNNAVFLHSNIIVILNYFNQEQFFELIDQNIEWFLERSRGEQKTLNVKNWLSEKEK